MKKIFKGIVIVAIIGMIVVLLTNIEPLTIYSKTETETKVYYTYEERSEYSDRWITINYGGQVQFTEQQPLFTEDNIDTLREIKHTDIINHKICYKLKGFEIIKSSG